MKAIILAAGRGRRLGELGNDKPKCMIDVQGQLSCLDLQLSELLGLGFEHEDIHIVVGYQSGMIRGAYPACNCIYNHWWNEFNTLHSLSLLRHGIDDGFILINGDVVMEEMDSLIASMMAREHSSCIVSLSGVDLESVKTAADGSDNHLLRIGKDIGICEPDGEYTGVAYFNKLGGVAMSRALDVLIGEENWKSYYEKAMQWVIDKGLVISPVYIPASHKWCEIDTPDDLEKARRLFNV